MAYGWSRKGTCCVLKVINTSPAPKQEVLELPKAAIKPDNDQGED
ncbi:hypothetical protein SAMN05192541_10315 [Bradyrhizobium arachidis]|nr:hypothetical protein SAMN05192541_10315 [Bradyrhizobium arachidis]